jgi:hypothetical protein
MTGAFLLVMAAAFFSLGYNDAVAQPWRELQLGLDVEDIFSNSTIVGNNTLVNGG